MNEDVTHKKNIKFNPGFIELSTQNKFILFGIFLSSIIFVLTAWIVMHHMHNAIKDSYYRSGLMLVSSLAIISSDIINTHDLAEAKHKLIVRAKIITEKNEDVAFINFESPLVSANYRDSDVSEENSQDVIVISKPILLDSNQELQNYGTVTVGFSGKSLKQVGNTARNAILSVFTISWLLSIVAVFLNSHLVQRQISWLIHGIERLSLGEFGYTISSKDLWGELKNFVGAFNNMSAKLRQYEEQNIDKITYEKNKLEAILLSIANGVIVCDNYDHVIIANKAAAKILDVEQQALIGTRLEDYVDDEGNHSFADIIRKFKSPLDNTQENEVLISEHLKMLGMIISVVISPIYDFKGDYLGYVIILDDITKEAEIDTMKDHFISNVSHELRTPVTIIRSYIDTLFNYGDQLDGMTRSEFLAILNKESDRLNRLVNTILDFSRLESPNVQLELELLDVKPIIELTIESVSVLAKEKDITLTSSIESNLPKLMVNPGSFERVLRNLLSNAIKYTLDSGRIKVRAEVADNRSEVMIVVEDTGIGIPKENIAKIFDRFYRIENKVHTVKGTGIGLHLVKLSVERHHHGRVFAESNEGTGSNIGFYLPIPILLDKEEAEALSNEQDNGDHAPYHP